MNDKYTNWAKKNATSEKVIEEIKQQDLDKIDELKNNAKSWDDTRRDSFKAHKAEQEGRDTEEEFNRFSDLLNNSEKDIIIVSVGTTGLKGKTTPELFDVPQEIVNQNSKSMEFLKEHCNDCPTQIAFTYFERDDYGFYKENPEKSLNIPLINVPKVIVERADETNQKNIERGRTPYDVFANGGINKQDILDGKGMRKKEVNDTVSQYMSNDFVKDAIFMEYSGSFQTDFCHNFIKKYATDYDRYADVDLCSAIDVYNRMGEHRLTTGNSSLKNVYEQVKHLNNTDGVELTTAYNKTLAIGTVLNEFCLREKMMMVSSKTILKYDEYLDTLKANKMDYDAVNGLRDEILNDVVDVIQILTEEPQSKLEEETFEENFEEYSDADYDAYYDELSREYAMEEDMIPSAPTVDLGTFNQLVETMSSTMENLTGLITDLTVMLKESTNRVEELEKTIVDMQLSQMTFQEKMTKQTSELFEEKRLEQAK